MNEDEASMDDPTESQLAELVRAAEAAAVPDALRAAVADADRPDAPQPGELWRVRHPEGGPVTLVWLRSLSPAGAVVVPVSFDVEQADDSSPVVPGEESPLGLPLALHLPAETTIDRRALFDRVGRLDPAPGRSVGPRIGSPLDERLEYRQALADRLTELAVEPSRVGDTGGADEWWPLDTPSGRSDLLKAIHQGLGESHPNARISPRPPATAASEALSALALVAELDAFVLVASVDRPLGDEARLEAAREVLHADQLLNAVCLVEPAPPYLAVVVDRRDVVAAIETPSGELRPPRHSRPPAAVGAALTKFLDATISPFGRLARTFVEGQAPDPRALAVDVSADAVRTIAASAKSFKTEGKRPGYERVKRHQASITRLVEEALNRPDVDVAALLDDGAPGEES
ncbi:MAG TPA: hypothetical protein VFS16_07910 [Acidimicrobiia bacterium]|nr:hypothetical protein [Acidimicrobiia bacterium]